MNTKCKKFKHFFHKFCFCLKNKDFFFKLLFQKSFCFYVTTKIFFVGWARLVHFPLLKFSRLKFFMIYLSIQSICATFQYIKLMHFRELHIYAINCLYTVYIYSSEMKCLLTIHIVLRDKVSKLQSDKCLLCPSDAAIPHK